MIDLTSFTLPDTWPFWARISMYLSALAWFALYGYMAAFAPKAPETILEFTEFRQIALTGRPKQKVYALTVLNNSGKTVQITELHLEWFNERIPGGGLSSNAGVDAVYVIANKESDIVVDSGDGSLRVRIDKPFANDPYLKASIPLAERLKDEGSTRFLVAIEAEINKFSSTADDLRATLIFSNGTTAERVLSAAR